MPVDFQPPGQPLERQYDYIVCGAGSAGSVVAGQLAANADVSVLLLEAGGNDEMEAVLDPGRWLSTLGSKLDWGFQAAPNPHLNGRAIPYSMGKVLGGGGSINVGIWSRGHKADWDYFAQVSGDEGWSHHSVTALYDSIENRAGTSPGEENSTRRAGPVWVQAARQPHRFYAAALESMQAQGIARFPDMNGALWESPNGCAYVDEIIRDGRRQSPFRSYVYPLLGQSNLTVLTSACVHRVLFDGLRASHVEFAYDGRLHRLEAGREIVLSLGAIQTPKVLMLSGIGDETKLKAFDIVVRQHLPAVGSHMHDHIAIGCAWEAADPADLPVEPRGQAVCFWKTDDSLALPNALAFAIPIVYATPENAARFDLPAIGWSLFAGLATEGRGELHLTSTDPTEAPRIETNFMSEPRDLASTRVVVEMCRSIGNDVALKRFARREALPGKLSDNEMEHFIRNGTGTFWHQSGAARMGGPDDAVVDGRLRVYGVDGLRIADASIMPRVTVGNTMAPSVVIGERAADFMRQTW